MEILATAKLVYCDGEAISSGWEKLSLVVKFKEDGKFFNRKLTKTLASTYNFYNSHMCHEQNRYSSIDEYFKDVEFLISDIPTIKRAAEKMILNYFKKKNENDLLNNKTKNISKRVNKMPKIDVKVKVN